MDTKRYDLSIDNTLGSSNASHVVIPSQKAIKEYVDNKINDSTISITQGGITKGSFTLNQSSAQTIALDAGGGNTIIYVDTICYDQPCSDIYYSLGLCFDIKNNVLKKHENNSWVVDSTISHDAIIYSIIEKAGYLYIYNNTELIPLNRGGMIVRNGTASFFNCYLPLSDSFVTFEFNQASFSINATTMYFTGLFTNNTNVFYERSIGTSHTICLKNNKSTDIDITIANINMGNSSGFISSGLDSNNSFTIKAGSNAEINVIFKDSNIAAGTGFGNYGLASIIVKTDFDNNIVTTS